MLRREGKQRGRRCRVLLSDLKALLLRPPPTPAPAPSDMNGAPSSHGASPTDRTREENEEDAAATAAAAAEWAGEGAERCATESPDGGSSSEDCSKEKLDERASLESCTESGARTPLCRICFQGADQVREGLKHTPSSSSPVLSKSLMHIQRNAVE